MTVTEHDPPAAAPGQGNPISIRLLVWIGAILGLLTLPALLIDRQLAAWIAALDKNSSLMRVVDLFQFPGSFLVLLGIGAGKLVAFGDCHLPPPTILMRTLSDTAGDGQIDNQYNDG